MRELYRFTSLKFWSLFCYCFCKWLVQGEMSLSLKIFLKERGRIDAIKLIGVVAFQNSRKGIFRIVELSYTQHGCYRQCMGVHW